MDLFGPISTASLSGKYYGYVIVDDYSRYTWVYFLRFKNETFQFFTKFSRSVQKEKSVVIIKLEVTMGRNLIT